MTMIEVAVSGSVGKFIATAPSGKISLDSVTLTPSAANATIKIRDGNASGEVVFFGRAPSAYGSKTWCVDHDFTKGCHVKVIGSNAVAYVEIE